MPTAVSSMSSPRISGQEDDAAGGRPGDGLAGTGGRVASTEALAWSVGDVFCPKGAGSAGCAGSVLSGAGIVTRGFGVLRPRKGT